jgi:Bifunctional DNA primase/polymerase, N-terminal
MQSSCVTPTPQKETEMPTKALQAAIELAAVGLPTFPCLENKHPATPHGFKDAAADPDKLRALWAQYPGELIAVPTGTVSGLDALDLDTKHEEARTWWRVNCRRFPSTRMHHTRAGGMHLIFRHDGGMRCSAGKIVLGVDTRASGGYIIWWPAAGLPVLSDAPPAPWPAWFLAEFRPKPPPSASPTGGRIPDHRFIAKLVTMVASATEGERNSLTFWCACRAGEMVAEGLLSAETAIAVITEAATRCGLPRAEAERTARSGVNTARGGHGA